MPLEKDDYKPGANPTDEQQVAYCKNQEKKYREQQNKILIELKEKFKQSCLNFNKFNLPILAKSADFQAYQLRYLNSHLLGDLRKTCDELITLLEQMQSQNEKVANDNKLSINFKKFITQLTTLKSNINEYVVNLQNNDTVQCSNLFKLVAEALQRLQYSLMHAFDAPDNPQEAFVDFKLLPGEILYKIANDYLSAKEGWSLALTCKGFFGKAPSNIDMAYVVKRKKLQELYNSVLITDMDSCFLNSNNKLYVWGNNTYGQLGLGDNNNRNTPVEFDLTRLNLSASDKVKQFKINTFFCFLLTEQGRCFVWGRNQSGQLGLGDNNDRYAPDEFNLKRLKLSASDKVKQFTIKVGSSFLLTEEGRCFFWGENGYGQLGLGDFSDRDTPVEFDFKRLKLSATDKVKQFIIKVGSSFLLTEEGRCFFWGYNEYGQLGLGDYTDRNAPVEFDLKRLNLSATDKIKQFMIRPDRSFLLTEEGRCFVWGKNRLGQLGLGDNNDRNTPVEFDLKRLNLSATDKIKQFTINNISSFLLTEEGRCFVWGSNGFGQLGLGDNNNRTAPVEFDLERLNLSATDKIKQFTINDGSSFLLTEEGRCFVWGSNGFGQLGLGNDNNGTAPVEFDLERLNLSATDKIKQFTINNLSSFLLTEEGRCFVWGDNAYGQLGLGDNNRRNAPVEVFYPGFKQRQLLLKSIIADLPQLALFATDKADYGKDCYGILIRKLALERNRINQLIYLPELYHSPWNDSKVVTKLLPFAWLHQPLIEELDRCPSERVQLATVLNKLLDIYEYFNDKASYSDLKTRQRDFIELLETLKSGEITSIDKLSSYLQQTATSRALKNVFELTLLSLTIGMPHISTRYYDIRQKLLSEVTNNPQSLPYLKLAAGILLKGLSRASQEDKIAFSLRSFIKIEATQIDVAEINIRKNRYRAY